jgi:hypothetical protein
MEVPVHREDKGVVVVEGYRTMIPVYHPVYAPVHPSAASAEELPTLLASGWFVSPEDMANGATYAQGTPVDADKDIDSMLSDEQRNDQRAQRRGNRK